MTKEIKTSIKIYADAKTIWDILIDFKKYSEWNPFIKSIYGKLEVNNKIEINIQNMNFKPLVKVYQPNHELKWLGHLWFKGLFDGEHQFLIEQHHNSISTFHQNEIFKGILVKLFSNKLDHETKIGFEEMNKALKLRAEKMFLRAV